MKSKNPYGISRNFGTTADLGIEVQAKSLPELFSAAAWALSNVIADFAQAPTNFELRVELNSDSLENLLFDWLSELIFIFDARKAICREFKIDIRGMLLSAELIGAVFDPAVHLLRAAPKAITYHEFKLCKIASGWRARFIIDV
jgi:SHS2 domain-containing protein